jgi:hypothetical protein
MNRRAFLITFLLIVLSLSSKAIADEYSLYDYTGEAVAYIDSSEEFTIYLWKGIPVAYLDDSSVFGFNGKHLGWFKDGIIWDHNGYAVGFVKGAVNKITKLEKLKGLKQLTPLKSLQRLQPLEPIFKDKWSSIPLEIFLSMGR